MKIIVQKFIFFRVYLTFWPYDRGNPDYKKDTLWGNQKLLAGKPPFAKWKRASYSNDI